MEKNTDIRNEDDRLAGVLNEASFRRLNLDEDTAKRPRKKMLKENGIPEENLKATYWG